MTKKNKRILLVINIMLIITFLLSSFIIYDLLEESEYKRYHEASQNNLRYLMQLDFSDYTVKEVAATFADGFDTQYAFYPSKAIIFNRSGEVIEQSGSYIQFLDANDKKRTVFIDEYLTPDIKKSILNYSTNSVFLEALELNYNEKEGEIIPVSVKLGDYNLHETETIDIILSDEKPTYTIKKEYFDHEKIDIKFEDINDRSRHRNTYRYLEDLILSQRDTVIKYAEAGVFDWGYSGGQEFLFFQNIKTDEGVYVLGVASVFHPFIDTVSSNGFWRILDAQILFFSVFSLTANILLIVYFKKTNKLEESKIAFTSAAAHELKTPLAVIENQCECIMENIAPEKNAEYVKSIYDESLRMNKLVATLLQYNRLASADNIAKEKCDLAEIVNAEIEKYRPLIESKNIQLETNVINKVEVNCNKELIALVIDNYLSNAVKHTAEGRKIAITLSEDTFSVFNEGKNIRPESEKNLWDIFYRDDEARNSDDNSTGMGLAICKQILEHHKFKYGFLNKQNGVEFYFKTN